MPHEIIRSLRLAHCARGPELCAKCREMDRDVPCLLDIDPPNPGVVARRAIEVQVGGEKAWREFDVLRTFQDEREARAYAAENGVSDIQLGPVLQE